MKMHILFANTEAQVQVTDMIQCTVKDRRSPRTWLVKIYYFILFTLF